MTPTQQKKLLKISILYRNCKQTRVISLINFSTYQKNMLLIDLYSNVIL